jgi:hypothetical protein
VPHLVGPLAQRDARLDQRPGRSNRHSSIAVAFSLNTAKFTPTPSHVAPSGYGAPGHTRMNALLLC